jgi:hypothetical protein
MHVNNYTGPVTIESNGAQGGTSDDGLNLNRCYGAGGGGSGGVIYFSGSTPGAPVTATVSGGNAGLEINHDVSCNPAIPSSTGSSGQIIPNYIYSRSLVLSNSYCSINLPLELAWFNAYYLNGHAILNWKIVQPELIDRFVIERSSGVNDWNVLYELSANDGIFIYNYNDASPEPGNNYYRIKVIKKNHAFSYSAVRKVLTPEKNQGVAIYPNPASDKIFITGVASSSQLTLFDQAGRLIWQKRIIANQNIIEVDLPSLSTGIYIIKVDQSVMRLLIR